MQIASYLEKMCAKNACGPRTAGKSLRVTPMGGMCMDMDADVCADMCIDMYGGVCTVCIDAIDICMDT